ncbi:MAG: type IV toxin-antitoxin system AbiEi family antitoxin [Candidatus Aminicenantes bacterium]
MILKTNKYRSSLSKKGSLLLSTLARENKNVFTIRDAKNILDEEPKKILSDLIRKKWILSLKRGLYVIVPLNIGTKGADDFIVHNFVIASYLVKPYFITFWSALNYHGLSDQIPTTVFVATHKALKSLEILNSRFLFVKLAENKFIGIQDIEIEGQIIRIANVNKTIADCLDHPEHSGGIEEVAKAIYFNHEELDLTSIKKYALEMENGTIFKRLGYILEQSDLWGKYKNIYSDIELTAGYPKLDTLSRRKGKYNDRWKLLVNVDINPERWMY